MASRKDAAILFKTMRDELRTFLDKAQGVVIAADMTAIALNHFAPGAPKWTGTNVLECAHEQGYI